MDCGNKANFVSANIENRQFSNLVGRRENFPQLGEIIKII